MAWGSRASSMRRLCIPVLAVILLTSTACSIPRWPVEGPLTSPFGFRWRAFLPEIHRGVDLRAPEGTPVRAMARAQVRFSGTMRGFGNVVWLDHGRELLTVYAHLSEIHVQTGAHVRGGEVIGLSGMTGSATAPHLHFEVWRRGRPVDPVPLLGGHPRP